MPVIHLSGILGLESTGVIGRFVIVRVGDRFGAIAVESVIEVTELEQDSLQQAPPLFRDAPGDCLEAIGTLDQDLLFVLEMARLLPADVWPAIDGSKAGAP